MEEERGRKMRTNDEDDLCTCEHCGLLKPWDDVHMHEDCWLCTACEGEHRKGFEACEHKWEPHVTQMGDEAQYCPECSTAVSNEDFRTVVGIEPPANVSG